MIRTLLCILALASFSFAQHEPAAEAPAGHSAAAGHQAEEHAAHEEKDLTLWKWANFAILAGLLGWVISKNAGPFFATRTSEIQKGISEAAAQQRDAEARAAAIQARLAGLQGEIENMRTEAQSELRAEAERIKAETQQMLAKIGAQAEQEIASAGKAARQELKAFSVTLAIQIAEQKLRNRMDDRAQQRLVDSFVNDLRAKDPRGAGPEVN